MRIGDIYTYCPDNNWCRHGIAIIHESSNGLIAWDTYWTGISDRLGEYGLVRMEKITPDGYVGNLDEFHVRREDDYEHYATKDRLRIPMGGGSAIYLVKKSAKIDAPRAIEYLQEQIADKESTIRMATRSIELLREEIGKLSI